MNVIMSVGGLGAIFSPLTILLLAVATVTWFVWLAFRLNRRDRRGAEQLKKTVPWAVKDQPPTYSEMAAERLFNATLAARRRPTDPAILEELRQARLKMMTWGGNPDRPASEASGEPGDTVVVRRESAPDPTITNETVTAHGKAHRTHPDPETG